MSAWKRDFIVIWISQFFSVMAFAFCLPFAPYFIQELGIQDPVALKMWVSIFAAATPLALAIFAPVWGAVADKFGRRIMLLRANFAAAVVLTLMGFADNIYILVGLRFLQGMLTGTVTAAQAMVAANTPNHRSGLALGALSAAVFSGGMIGSAAGGIFAHYFGYRQTFIAGGLIVLLAALVVWLGTRENFVRPTAEDLDELEGDRPPLSHLRGILPILLLIVAMATARQFDMAMLPLLVQEIHGTFEGVSLWTGWLFAIGGVAGLLAGLILGHLADRITPATVAKVSALGAALLLIPQGLAHGFGLLFPARFGMLFCSGGLDPVFMIWLTKITPAHRRGLVFGWASTARSIGWIIAPLASGLVAAGFGIRSVFFVGSLLFFSLWPLIVLATRWTAKNMSPPARSASGDMVD